MSDTAPTVTAPAPSPAPTAVVAPAPTTPAPTSDAKLPLEPPGAKKVDAPTKVDAPVVEVEPKVSKHFAELERRKAQIAEREKKIAEQAKAQEPELAAFREWQKAKEAKNPVALLKHAGLSQSDLATALLNGDTLEDAKPDPLAEMRAEIEAMKAEKKAAADKAAADATAAENARNMDTTRTVIKQAITSEHPKLSKLGDAGVELVFDTMTDVFVRNKGQVPPIAKVAAEVEAFLKKFAGEEAAPAAEAKVEAPKAPTAKADAKPKVVTITNKTNAEQPPAVQPSDTEANRKRAIANMQARMAKKSAALSGKSA